METRQTKGTGEKLEKVVQAEILEWLQKEQFFYWRNNNTPIFDVRKKAFRALPKHIPKGLPDIFVVRGGRLIGFEVKSQKKNARPQSEAQKEIEEKFFHNGADYLLVYDLKNVKMYFGYE